LTETASTAKEARKIIKRFQPDLVIVDINLPDDTGFNICQDISNTNTLIVVLSSMKDNEYILEAFEKGADDYIVKPFDLNILKARIKALFRRQKTISYPPENQQPLVLDKLTIDFYRREVALDNQIVPLTALEFDLLYFLANNANRVWDRSEIISAIWNKQDYVGDDRKVDIHIGRIRKKIGDLDGRLIKTIWGRGYMFELSERDKVELTD
jgi:DNA-binding response OmpR family regulator